MSEGNQSEDRRKKISEDTQRWLWAASAGVCEYGWGEENCVERLMQKAPGEQLVFIGQTAHVVPIGGSGPRAGTPPLGGDVDAPENLMLLCYKHHRFVDKDPGTFDVGALSKMKRHWEEFVDPLRRLTGARSSADTDYDRVRDFVGAGFRLKTEDWENFMFNITGGRGRPIWLTGARIEARSTAIEVEARWTRPSMIDIFKGLDDVKFEEAILQLSEAMRRVDYVFGEGVAAQKPYGWQEYDWTAPHVGDWPECATMTAAEYDGWFDGLQKAVAHASKARDTLVAEVVRRDHTLLNAWPA